MTEIKRLKREELVFVAIDYQERLLPAMSGRDRIEKGVIRLAAGLNVFNIPKIVTTQYAKGLGPTVSRVAEAFGEFEPIDKSAFSAFKTEEFREKLEKTGKPGKKTVILAGIETHICVEQTALDLLESGYDVVLAADCCGCRDDENHRIALRRLAGAGVTVTSGESILYEILKSAKAPEFKAISAIVK
ncbi:MAG: hydrolase [Anaerovoracaceae bacterium]|nr:hydrolase [Anaerovoracaceae bacterium]